MSRLLRLSLWWWLIGYLSITVINIILTLGLGRLLEPEWEDAALDVAYERTVAAHVIVGVAVWVLAAKALWRRRDSAQLTRGAATVVALIWVVVSLLVDGILFIGVLSDTPAGAPPETFYIDNQPWTAMYYVAVMIGPPVALWWVRRHPKPPTPDR